MTRPEKSPDKPPGKKAFPLRLDPALYAAVERLAAGELRSVNAQIEFLLREAVRARGVKSAEAGSHADGPAAFGDSRDQSDSKG